MCKQKTVLAALQHTGALPEWFVLHAEAQSDDYIELATRAKTTMEKVDALDKRMLAVEDKLDSVVATVSSMQTTLTELTDLIKDGKMKEKAWAWDGLTKFFSARTVKVGILLLLGFAAGAGKDSVLTAFGLL
jgi:hypothetical protein